MIGRTFGLVTVTSSEVAANRTRYFAVCTCGDGRWFQLANLKSNPPKTHRPCFKARQYVMRFNEDKARRT